MNYEASIDFLPLNRFFYRAVNKIAASSTTDADAYVFLGYEDNSPGTIGIAWINTTCAIKPYRTSITEWFINDAITAAVTL